MMAIFFVLLFCTTGVFSISFVSHFLNCSFHSYVLVSTEHVRCACVCAYFCLNQCTIFLSLSRHFYCHLFDCYLLILFYSFIYMWLFFSLAHCTHSCMCARKHIGECSECSQKLMIWKLDENKRKKRDKRKNAKANNSIPKIVVTSIEKEGSAAVAGLPPPPTPPPPPSSSTVGAGMKKSSRKKMYLYI